jgi:AcrR family transcriptional regulator
VAHDRLLDTAIREFGLKGLEGASTRCIAAAAGTAMSAITYHYGGKDGLYLAAADHIAAQMAEELAVSIDVDAILAAADRVSARRAIHAIMGRFADKLMQPDSESRSLFIIREQMHPTEAFDRIYGGVMGEMLENLVRLVCLASGDDDEARARLLTVTLIGQVIVLRASRASCLRLLRRDTVDAALVDNLTSRVAANVDAILDSIISTRQDSR